MKCEVDFIRLKNQDLARLGEVIIFSGNLTYLLKRKMLDGEQILIM